MNGEYGKYEKIIAMVLCGIFLALGIGIAISKKVRGANDLSKENYKEYIEITVQSDNGKHSVTITAKKDIESFKITLSVNVKQGELSAREDYILSDEYFEAGEVIQKEVNSGLSESQVFDSCFVERIKDIYGILA